jgi:hypothetical protein
MTCLFLYLIISWEVKKIGKKLGLSCKRSWKFHPDLYPGYAHRRTLGFKEGTSVADNSEILRNPPRTYCFIERGDDGEKEKLAKKVAEKEAKKAEKELDEF